MGPDAPLTPGPPMAPALTSAGAPARLRRGLRRVVYGIGFFVAVSLASVGVASVVFEQAISTVAARAFGALGATTFSAPRCHLARLGMLQCTLSSAQGKRGAWRWTLRGGEVAVRWVPTQSVEWRLDVRNVHLEVQRQTRPAGRAHPRVPHADALRSLLDRLGRVAVHVHDVDVEGRAAGHRIGVGSLDARLEVRPGGLEVHGRARVSVDGSEADATYTTPMPGTVRVRMSQPLRVDLAEGLVAAVQGATVDGRAVDLEDVELWRANLGVQIPHLHAAITAGGQVHGTVASLALRGAPVPVTAKNVRVEVDVGAGKGSVRADELRADVGDGAARVVASKCTFAASLSALARLRRRPPGVGPHSAMSALRGDEGPRAVCEHLRALLVGPPSDIVAEFRSMASKAARRVSASLGSPSTEATGRERRPSWPPVRLEVDDIDIAWRLTPDTPALGALSDLAVAVEPRTETPGWRVRATVAGSGGQQALNVSAELAPNGAIEAGHVHSEAALFARILSALSPFVVAGDHPSLLVDLEATRLHDGGLRFAGSVDTRDIGVDWWRIAPEPVVFPPTHLDVAVEAHDGGRLVEAEVARARIGKLEGSGRLSVDARGEQPVVDLRVEVPKQPCARFVSAIPEAMIPHLHGLRVRGRLGFKLRFSVDMARPEKLRLDIAGTPLDECRPVRLGSKVGVDWLTRNDWKRHPVVDGEKLDDVVVGPASDNWVWLSALPDYVSMTALITEDWSFFAHHGFGWGLIRRAIRLNLTKRRYVYGGSTISQQLVKNLFLSRDKNLSRKLEEAIITWAMEQRVPKNRILELYLNCIEYGPHIWGLRAAARHYFGVEPQRLTLVQSLFLMVSKPNPKWAYWAWRRGRLTKTWFHTMGIRIDQLVSKGWITPEQAEEARRFEMHFYYPEGHPPGLHPRKQHPR